MTADRLQTSTLTFLFTDVEGSTRLWAEDAAAMDAAMSRLNTLVAGRVAAHGGTLPPDQGEGDARLAVFDSAPDALVCALQIQLALWQPDWPVPLSVRKAEIKARHTA